MISSETHGAIQAVWRIESARLIARLARMVGDVGLAEELAQDALVTALEKWPETGVPDNPGAWLMTAAKNQAVLRTMDILMDLLRDSRARSLQGPGRAEKSLDGHRRILDAIRRRDPEAASQRMRGHIEEIEGTLFPENRPAATGGVSQG